MALSTAIFSILFSRVAAGDSGGYARTLLRTVDYIHVTDLAEAHVLALRALEGGLPPGVYNLGNERGYSVREVVEVARHVTGRDFPVVEGDRRPGDPAVLVASSRRIREELGWRPRYGGLETIVRTAWEWHRRHPEGYGDGTCCLPVAGGRLS